MAANSPAAPKTVGHLIQRLEMFERDLEVVAVNALTGTLDSFGGILAAALLPPDNEKKEQSSTYQGTRLKLQGPPGWSQTAFTAQLGALACSSMTHRMDV